MQIIQTDLVSSVSSSEGNLDSFPIANILTDIPSQEYICDATSCTITINIDSGMKGFFISGLMADSASMGVSISGASGTIAVSTDDYSDIKELSIGQEIRISPEYFNFEVDGSSITRATSPNTLTAATVTLSLTTSTDLKDSPASANTNAIYQWDHDSGGHGRFEDSSGNAVNLNDFANVLVGSIVTRGTDYQVLKIIGDGTATNAVQLADLSATTITSPFSGTISVDSFGPTTLEINGDVTLAANLTLAEYAGTLPADGTVTAIKNPIKLGIARAGSVLDVENPQQGFSQSFTDYSIKRTINDGGYDQTQRNITKNFNAEIPMTDSNAQSFISFYRANRSRPFPAILIDGLDSNRNGTTRLSGFFYFPAAPRINFISHSGEVKTVSLSFREVI
jgi:hypothetical protein